MRTVDKQDIARLQLREKFQTNFLDVLLDQSLQPWKSFAKKVAWKWFNTNDRREAIFRCGLTQCERRKTATHFDNQARLEVTNHAVGHQRVNTIKKTVAKIKPIVLRRWRSWKPLKFVAEF